MFFIRRKCSRLVYTKRPPRGNFFTWLKFSREFKELGLAQKPLCLIGKIRDQLVMLAANFSQVAYFAQFFKIR